MAVTVRDVARVAGVSVKTVSNALHDRPNVSAATKRRVLEAAAELGYRPNPAARRLRSGRTGVISLVIPELRNPYFAELAAAVAEAARAQGLSVIIEQTGGDMSQELHLVTGADTPLIDGTLYNAHALDESYSDMLLAGPTPIVLLGDRYISDKFDRVTMNSADATQAATEHLLALGRRRIVALGPYPRELRGPASFRLDGYKHALLQAGVPYDEDLVVPVREWFRGDAALSMRRFIARSVPFDAVVAFNDLIAVGALRALHDAGMDVPDRVAVIGFDNLEECKYTYPSLSTVDFGLAEMAEVALGFLRSRIEGTYSSGPGREHRTRYRIVGRESTAES
ncbi:LacI family DNA-binding transcriptional regulator [Microbispora sp. NPDC046933]|uniref:LacI family DNA-binding transcriptional regulator n=1 Tax=Microbispora sp. NPDC046933 TaxID=3155618 RepID=UPI0033FF468F